MSGFKRKLKLVLLNFLAASVLFLVVAYVVLQVFLPSYTKHGQTVTVPSLEGYSYEELDQLLTLAELRLEISPDSGYNAEVAPLTVLRQNPRAGSKVKKNRKVYLTLNAENAPLVKMPNLVNSQLRNVQEILANMGLVRGEIVYVPDIGINVVLEQKYRGRNIPEGFELPKGSQIDLVVGDGMGNQILDVPMLIGLDEVDAEFLIIGSGLRLGRISYVQTDTVPQGTIVEQSPPAGFEVKTGDPIDLWISELENR